MHGVRTCWEAEATWAPNLSVTDLPFCLFTKHQTSPHHHARIMNGVRARVDVYNCVIEVVAGEIELRLATMADFLKI